MREKEKLDVRMGIFFGGGLDCRSVREEGWPHVSSFYALPQDNLSGYSTTHIKACFYSIWKRGLIPFTAMRAVLPLTAPNKFLDALVDKVF